MLTGQTHQSGKCFQKDNRQQKIPGKKIKTLQIKQTGSSGGGNGGGRSFILLQILQKMFLGHNRAMTKKISQYCLPSDQLFRVSGAP